MVYNAPFTAVTKALYETLRDASDVGIVWFDSAVPIEEIQQLHKDQERFTYGIFGAADADCADSTDTALWTVTMNLEVYSNYRGRKVIADTLNKLLNYLSGPAWEPLQKSFYAGDYNLVSVSLGTMHIYNPIYSDIGIWQSGEVQITFTLNQI
nr:MAG TPA: hypothetical protein [Bacteriophage sp.]